MRFPAGSAAVFAVLALLWAAPAAAENCQPGRGCTGKALVTAPRLRVRRAPALSGAPLGALTEGMPVVLLDRSTFTATIEERTAPWYKVRALSGRFLEGWTFGGFLAVAPEPVNGVDPWLAEMCYADIRVFGESASQASALLGAPLSIDVEERPNRHDPAQTDKAKTLTFAGAALYFLETPYKTFLERTSLTADVPGLNDLAKMDSTPRGLREVFGNPRADDMKSMRYDCRAEQNDALVFSFTMGKLSAIDFLHSAD